MSVSSSGGCWGWCWWRCREEGETGRGLGGLYTRGSKVEDARPRCDGSGSGSGYYTGLRRAMSPLRAGARACAHRPTGSVYPTVLLRPEHASRFADRPSIGKVSRSGGIPPPHQRHLAACSRQGLACVGDISRPSWVQGPMKNTKIMKR